MLEIALLWVLGKKIHAMAKQRGRNGTGYVVLFVAMWFGCELMGGVSGAIVSMVVGGGKEPEFFLIWGCGLVGAALGAVLCFVIVNALPPAQPPLEVEPAEDEFYPPQ